MSHLLLAQANSLHIPLRDNSIHCIITSPPYFGIRDYGTATWEGGDLACPHQPDHPRGNGPKQTSHQVSSHAAYGERHARWQCHICGAVRHDEQLGLEQLHDCGAWARSEPPCGQSCYICHMRAVAKELWRVLRNDGTLWINIADTYAGSWGAQSRPNGNDIGSTLQGGSMLSARQIQAHPRGTTHVGSLKHTPGIKAKSLLGIPQRLALALQSDGFIWRSDIIWHKPSCMPESVQDRPTRSHEYVLMFAKQGQYFYDAEAIKEAGSPQTYARFGTGQAPRTAGPKWHDSSGGSKPNAWALGQVEGRRARSVWTIPSEPLPSGTGHYAAFPTALAERMVRAGTSQHGVCSRCGAAWQRVVEPTGAVIRQRNGPGSDQYHTQANGHHGATSSFTTGVRPLKQTTGWRPTCPHSEAAVVPAIVLDPFAGSGTTGIAARAVGRQAVLLDLSWPYLHTIARERLGLADLARWHGAAAVPAPVSYDDLPLFA